MEAGYTQQTQEDSLAMQTIRTPDFLHERYGSSKRRVPPFRVLPVTEAFPAVDL